MNQELLPVLDDTCLKCTKNTKRELQKSDDTVHDETISNRNTNITPIQKPRTPRMLPSVPSTPLVNQNAPNLPKFIPVIRTPTHPWHNLSNSEFVKHIDKAYNEIITWRKNPFKILSGKAVKDFIKELTFWIKKFNSDTQFHGIALKIFMLLPSLLLQKPSKDSKAKEHLKKLEERLKSWNEGDINILIREGRHIQKRLASSRKRSTKDSARIFSKLKFQGKINAALKLLSDDWDYGILPADENTLIELKLKHPSPSPIHDESLFQGPIERVHANYFGSLDEAMIKNSARLTKGSAGPSGLDSEHYKTIFLSRKNKNESKNLREQIALFAKKIATTIVDPSALEPYLVCRLIPLNRNPGVRPIGIGEVLRRIVGKAIGWVLKPDIQAAAGPLQASTGLKGGAEAAIHSMRTIFENDDTEAVILVDAENAFNCLNRKVALHNMRYICPPFATILINTYRSPSRLIVSGKHEITSREGTTQGDNLAMSFYVLGISPLIQRLKNTAPPINQIWLADDVTGAGKLEDAKNLVG